jgi:hypothetical protein
MIIMQRLRMAANFNYDDYDKVTPPLGRLIIIFSWNN